MIARPLLIIALLLLSSCRQQSVDGPPGGGPGPVSNGVYVLNEGLFGDPSGARLTFLDLLTDSVYFDVFESANGGAHLGSLGDDLTIYGGRIFALMSGSEEVVVMDTADHHMVQRASFAGASPHDLLIDPVRNSLYISGLFSGSVLRADLTTLSVQQTIPVGLNPQGLLLANDNIFVCNSGFGSDNRVTVISAVTQTVTTTVTVGDGPTGAVVGPDGRVWVVCTGNAFGTPPTNGSVHVISPITFMVEDVLPFPENLWGPITTGSDGNLYLLGITPGSFYGGPIHRILAASLAIETRFIDGTFYGLRAEPVSGYLYAADANEFQSDGEVRVYNTGGGLVRSFPAQRGPASFAFRY